MVEVLQDFLARLGFEVDEAGASEFHSTLATGATRVAAFGAAIQAMAVGAYAAIHMIAESKSEMLALADAVAVPVGRLEELGFVADVTGSSADALASSLESLNERLGNAAIGQGLDTFHRLGVRVRDANGEIRNSADVLMEVGEKIKDMNRAQASMFLGQLGIDRSLVRMLTSDVDGLRRTYRDMYEAVGVDSQQAAEDFREFTGEVKALKTMFRMVGEGVAAIMVGEMGRDVAQFRKLIQENVGKIIPVLKTLISVVLRIGKVFFALTARLVKLLGMLVDWFGRLDDSTQNIILAVLGFAAAWRWLNLAFLATPIGAIITGLIALLGLIDDFMVWKEGGESLIDWGPWADDIDALMAALSGLLGLLGELWNLVKGPLFAVFGLWGKQFLAVLSAMTRATIDLVTAIVRLFQGDFSGAVGAVAQAFGHLWEIVEAVMENIKSAFELADGVIGNVVSWAAEGLGGLLGLGGSGAPVLMPPQAQLAASAGAAGDTAINSSTVIRVDGARNPEATARAVAGEQRRVNADLVRHAKGAVR